MSDVQFSAGTTTCPDCGKADSVIIEKGQPLHSMCYSCEQQRAVSLSSPEWSCPNCYRDYYDRVGVCDECGHVD